MTIKKHNLWHLAIFFLVFALTLPTAFAQAQKYDALLGVWDVETEGAQYTFVFTFTIEEGELAGVFEGQSGEVEMQNLTVEDNQVTFTVEIDAGGQGMAIDFEAIIDGGSLEGMLSMEFGEVGITGTKRE
jgi:polyisoprenoid-binding protein YceI